MSSINFRASDETPEFRKMAATPRLQEEGYQKKTTLLSGAMRKLVVALGLAGVMVGAARTDMVIAKKDKIVENMFDADVVGNRVSKNVRRMLLSKDALDKLEDSERQEYMKQRFEELMIICSAIESLQMKMDELRKTKPSLPSSDGSTTSEHLLNLERAMLDLSFAVNEALKPPFGKSEDPLLPLFLSVAREASQSMKASSVELIIPEDFKGWKEYFEKLDTRIASLDNYNKSMPDDSGEELKTMFDAYRSAASGVKRNASSQEGERKDGEATSFFSRTGLEPSGDVDQDFVIGYVNEVKKLLD